MVNKQCRYCHFYSIGEKRQGKIVNCKIATIRDVQDGTCNSFRPRIMFGICGTCTYRNVFKPMNCSSPEQPNRKTLYNNRNDTTGELDVCDRYNASYLWKSSILKNLLDGCCPANFNPETWQFTDRMESEKIVSKMVKEIGLAKEIEQVVYMKKNESLGQINLF